MNVGWLFEQHNNHELPVAGRLGSVFCPVFLVGLIVSYLCLSQAEAKHPIAGKYKIIAGFVLQLTSFVVWPQTNKKQLEVCIAGKDPFRDYIDQMVQSRPTNRLDQTIVLRRIAMDDNIAQCQLIYSHDDNIEKLVEQISPAQPILLVGEGKNFIDRGGMIHFYQERQQMRLEVNLTAVQRHQLTISSELLKLVKLTDKPNGMKKQ
ncbi:MAG: YfiR family protein [Gammaproteobacteria bacterium]|nr:YfiR family protein [Gammaproteobacteria bacterium]